MQKLFLVLMLVLAGTLTNAACGQDEPKPETEDKSAKTTTKNLDMAVEMTATIMSKMFQKADLDDDQKKKVDEILQTNIKILVHTRQDFHDFLTGDERKKFNSAMKMARKAKYDNEKAEAFALKKLKFSDEKLAEYNALKVKVEGLSNKINDSVKALLTDEQRRKLPIFLTDAEKAEIAKQADGSAAKDAASKAEKDGE